ncbi:tetratricopeptide repeat protein [Paenibacillus sp. GCM10023250]|uniref:tetratricopeptide repeat protein n=1 Tax=Paenibacillus sp. GCM10023250 TaxID=3252648 RepID=UPI00361A4FC0
MKNRAPYCFAFILGLFLMLVSGTCMASGNSGADVQDYRAQANQFVAAQQYEQAASVLEELLARNPDLTDEIVYKQLTHIYDDYLFEFDQALTLYHTYLDRFPNGIFAGDFRDRVTYLEERRSEWQALREFRSVQSEDDHRSVQERLAAVETLLSKNENALIAPEMHLYLANLYAAIPDYQAAGEHAAALIDSFGQAGMTDPADQASALRLYAGILVKQHHLNKAIRALDRAIALGGPEENFNDAVKRTEIIKHRNMLAGFIGCLSYYLAVVLLLMRRYSRAGHGLERLVRPVVLLALVSLGPIVFLKLSQEPEANLRFFFWQAGLAIVSILAVKLLAPLSRITGRFGFISMTGLHMAAASFMAYYLTVYSGKKIVINTAIEVDRDPLTTTYIILLWSSMAASLLIAMIAGFRYAKAKPQ